MPSGMRSVAHQKTRAMGGFSLCLIEKYTRTTTVATIRMAMNMGRLAMSLEVISRGISSVMDVPLLQQIKFSIRLL